MLIPTRLGDVVAQVVVAVNKSMARGFNEAMEIGRAIMRDTAQVELRENVEGLKRGSAP